MLKFVPCLAVVFGLSGCMGQSKVDVDSTINVKLGFVVVGKRTVLNRHYLQLKPVIGLTRWTEVDKLAFDAAVIGQTYPGKEGK